MILMLCTKPSTLQWRHNQREDFSNHQPHDWGADQRKHWGADQIDWGADQRKHQRSASLGFVREIQIDWGADQRKHQRSASLGFVRGIHRWLVNPPHKGPVTRKMFPFDDVIMPSHILLMSMQCLSQWEERIGMQRFLSMALTSNITTLKWKYILHDTTLSHIVLMFVVPISIIMHDIHY